MFDEYIGLYGARLYALCLRLCRYGADAQDLYQETWLRAWRARARYDTSRPFDAWLSRICVNASGTRASTGIPAAAENTAGW